MCLRQSIYRGLTDVPKCSITYQLFKSNFNPLRRIYYHLPANPHRHAYAERPKALFSSRLAQRYARKCRPHNHHSRLSEAARPAPRRPSAPAARIVSPPAMRGFRVPTESGGAGGGSGSRRRTLFAAGRSEESGEAERSRVATSPFPRLSFTSAATHPPRSGTEPPPRSPRPPPPAAPPPLPTSDMAAPPALAVSGAGGGAPPGGPRPGGGFRRSPQQRWCFPRRVRGCRGAACSSPVPSVSTGSGRRAPPPSAVRSRPAPGFGSPGNRRRGPRSPGSGGGRAAEPAAGDAAGRLAAAPRAAGPGPGPGPGFRGAGRGLR